MGVLHDRQRALVESGRTKKRKPKKSSAKKGASIPVGHGRIECVEGDITAQDTEAVVNAANNELWMGSGVAGAIKRVGGQIIEDEAVRQAPIPVGDAVVTTGGKLRAHHVIHAAAMGTDLRTSAELIRNATGASLLRAQENGLRSVAFPSIGTGVGGFPMAECAKIMIAEAVAHLTTETSVRLVRFVLWDKEAYEVFAAELHRQKD